MLSTRFRFFSLAVIAILAIALVACDDDNDVDDTAPVDPTPANDEPAPTPAPDDDDAAPTPAPDDDAAPDNGEPAEPADAISLSMIDIDYSESQLTINVGEEVEIALANEGSLEHDFTIDEIDVDYEVTGAAVANGDWDLHVDVPPGESGSVIMTVHEAGEYEFYCTVPGHREAGMEGTLTVE